jgi:hypothetical protein
LSRLSTWVRRVRSRRRSGRTGGSR